MNAYLTLFRKELKSIFGVGMLIALIISIVSAFYSVNYVAFELYGGIHRHIVWQDRVRSDFAIYDSWVPLVFYGRIFIKKLRVYDPSYSHVLTEYRTHNKNRLYPPYLACFHWRKQQFLG